MQVCTTARARATIGGPMRESRTPCNAAAFHRTTTLSLALLWPSTPSGQIRTARVSKPRKYMGSLDVNVDGAAIGVLPPAILDHRIYTNHLFSPRIDTATASRVSVLARRGRYFTRLSVRRAETHQKNTPLCSVPNCAKLVVVVAG